jgi:hypothetical protein
MRQSPELVPALDQREDSPVGHGHDKVNSVFAHKIKDTFGKTRRLLGGDGILEAATAIPGKGGGGEEGSVGTHSNPIASAAQRPRERQCGIAMTIKDKYFRHYLAFTQTETRLHL